MDAEDSEADAAGEEDSVNNKMPALRCLSHNKEGCLLSACPWVRLALTSRASVLRHSLLPVLVDVVALEAEAEGGAVAAAAEEALAVVSAVVRAAALVGCPTIPVTMAAPPLPLLSVLPQLRLVPSELN